MPPRYDLLVIDLDGTLLAPDGSVSRENVAAVERAQRAGIEIMIATGRALVESHAALEAIDHDGLVVAAGGSMLCDAATGSTLERTVLEWDLVVAVTEALVHHDHKVLLLKDASVTGYDYLAVGPGELDPASRWWFETLPVRVRFAHSIEDDPHEDETVRMGAVATEAELAPLARALEAELGDRAFLQHWPAVTASGVLGAATHLLEVFTPDVSKWTMVAKHCQGRGIPRERVAAIGDGLNDVQIVREAGLGVAMGNADPRVAAVADRTTSANDADGVALAIDRIVEGAW
jgi:HAD superfamily hydrolase (TIGR01484 family)